jgi:pyruvate dehydrogenase E2 component (dihydrolipoamide acetyltransferase)
MAQIVNMPKLGFDMAEGTLIRWVVQEGESIAKGAILAEIETDKATVEVESIYDGVVAKHLVGTGEIVPVNTPIAVIAEQGEEVHLETLVDEGAIAKKSAQMSGQTAGQITPSAPEAAPVTEGNLPGGVRSSPVARRLADEKGIDLRQVNGSGPGGRITRKDVEDYLSASREVKPEMVAAKPVVMPAPLLAAQSRTPQMEDESIPLNRLRAAIGRRMTEVKQQVPHFYVTHEYDMAALTDLRLQVNALLPEEEKTSINDYILKAVALALREYPNLNASFQGDHILHHGAVNIGVAVAVEGGLLTVVCHDADQKPIRQIAGEVRRMVSRAREGKVRPEDIEGSTFSVSNLGMFDVEHFIAIINPPEAAILAVGSVLEIHVVKDGQIIPGLRMRATISVDHRVSDGAEAARFLQALAKYIEQPLSLLV